MPISDYDFLLAVLVEKERHLISQLKFTRDISEERWRWMTLLVDSHDRRYTELREANNEATKLALETAHEAQRIAVRAEQARSTGFNTGWGYAVGLFGIVVAIAALVTRH